MRNQIVRPLSAILVLTISVIAVIAQVHPLTQRRIFENSSLAAVWVDVSPEDVAALHHPDNLTLDDEKPARFIYVSDTRRDPVENVGLLLRGNTSRFSQKKSYRVSFNAFTKGGKYRGVEKFNINGEHSDPTLTLNDNGRDGDRAVGDGYFSGTLTSVDSQGSLIYTFAARDVTGKTATSKAAVFSIGFDEPGIVINEFMASNRTTLADEFGEFDDWVEIYNTGSAPVNLSGYFLSDDFSRPDRWRMPDLVSAPGEHIVLWLDGQPEQGPLHAPFRLNRDGERIGIFAGAESGFFPLDTLSFGPQIPDLSYGRLNDGGPVFDFLNPTPGGPNPGVAAVAYANESPLGVDRLSVYPNPFAGSATVEVALAMPGTVDIRVHDLLGREVASLASGLAMAPGVHRIPWSVAGFGGSPLPAGLYVIRAKVSGQAGHVVHAIPLVHIGR